jgi:hypothetical protein
MAVHGQVRDLMRDLTRDRTRRTKISPAGRSTRHLPASATRWQRSLTNFPHG